MTTAKPAAPAADSKPAFQTKPRVAGQDTSTLPPSTVQRPATPPPSRSGVVLRTLTNEEREARERALADPRVREAEERKRQEEELVRRKAQDERDLSSAKPPPSARPKMMPATSRKKTARRKAEEAAKKLAPKTPHARR